MGHMSWLSLGLMLGMWAMITHDGVLSLGGENYDHTESGLS